MSTTKRFDTPNLSIKLNKTHRPKIQKEKKKTTKSPSPSEARNNTLQRLKMQHSILKTRYQHRYINRDMNMAIPKQRERFEKLLDV